MPLWMDMDRLLLRGWCAPGTAPQPRGSTAAAPGGVPSSATTYRHVGDPSVVALPPLVFPPLGPTPSGAHTESRGGGGGGVRDGRRNPRGLGGGRSTAGQGRRQSVAQRELIEQFTGRKGVVARVPTEARGLTRAIGLPLLGECLSLLFLFLSPNLFSCHTVYFKHKTRFVLEYIGHVFVNVPSHDIFKTLGFLN